MKGRTYRYIDGDALFPFGFGLSYTNFEYSDFNVVEKNDDAITVSLKLKNTGSMKAKEISQIYASYKDSRTYTPHYQLCAVKTAELDAGEEATITMTIDAYWVKAVLEDGSRVNPDGEIVLYAGGHQPDNVSNELTGNTCQKIKLQ